jgi:WD40 repeat protein
MVKCWDLEYNKVVRHYHGHLSGVFALSLHPILDLLISGGRDSVARVWDMRTKNQVHVLGGHVSTVSSILTAGVDPQVSTSVTVCFCFIDSCFALWASFLLSCITVVKLKLLAYFRLEGSM